MKHFRSVNCLSASGAFSHVFGMLRVLSKPCSACAGSPAPEDSCPRPLGGCSVAAHSPLTCLALALPGAAYLTGHEKANPLLFYLLIKVWAHFTTALGAVTRLYTLTNIVKLPRQAHRSVVCTCLIAVPAQVFLSHQFLSPSQVGQVKPVFLGVSSNQNLSQWGFPLQSPRALG